MANYFNTLNLRQQLAQLGKCRFMGRDEFADGASYLQGKGGEVRAKSIRTMCWIYANYRWGGTSRWDQLCFCGLILLIQPCRSL